MIKYYCDKCKNEILDDEGVNIIELREYNGGIIDQNILCVKCVEEVKEMLE